MFGPIFLLNRECTHEQTAKLTSAELGELHLQNWHREQANETEQLEPMPEAT
jgi:hypothetical protein